MSSVVWFLEWPHPAFPCRCPVRAVFGFMMLWLEIPVSGPAKQGCVLLSALWNLCDKFRESRGQSLLKSLSSDYFELIIFLDESPKSSVYRENWTQDTNHSDTACNWASQKITCQFVNVQSLILPEWFRRLNDKELRSWSFEPLNYSQFLTD